MMAVQYLIQFTVIGGVSLLLSKVFDRLLNRTGDPQAVRGDAFSTGAMNTEYIDLMIAELEEIASLRSEGGRSVTMFELDFTKMSFSAEDEPINEKKDAALEDEEHYVAVLGPDTSDRTDLHRMHLQILTVDKFKPV